MRRETKYTLAGFLIFVYSLGLQAILMISFTTATGALNSAFAITIAVGCGALCACLLHIHHKKIRFRYRLILLFGFATIVILAAWVLICQGTFVKLQ